MIKIIFNSVLQLLVIIITEMYFLSITVMIKVAGGLTGLRSIFSFVSDRGECPLPGTFYGIKK